ncbi:MAG TPA: glycosyltransferase family 39 protein, partial [Pseudonocardiaceae bacterium]|nr:glycosyltransferase family 39 protein [Pseudonocardiaceae bacterium]
GQMWQMFGDVDAVHGLYYLFMHAWFGVFPPTEFWSRAPSALAIGGAAAGIVVLGKQFSSRTVGLAAGALCAVLPRATWAGIEARPYALSMMAAVWLTVLLVHAVRRGTAWLWVAYGVALACSTLLDIYLVLLWVAHAALIVLFHRSRTALAGFGISSALSICAVAPFIAVVVGQVHQISWITPIGRRTVEDVAVQQYFDRNPVFALLAALVVVVAVVLWLSKVRRLGGGDRQLIVLAVAWAAIPTAVIVLWSSVAHAIYTPRYLAFTAPAVALVLGVCIGALASAPWLATAVVGVFVVASAPSYLFAQRVPYAKYGMDYSQVADLITARAAPGDCLLVNDTVTFHPAPMRPLLAARPDAYRKLVDVSLWQRATDRRDVFDTNLIPEASVGPLERCKELWIITQADRALPAHEQGAPMAPGPQFGGTTTFAVTHDMGFWLLERWQFNLVQVIKAARV